MKIAGVVAEYNPFHNGHKYHLEETRRMGATHIVVVMSGAVVQRGDTAIADKYFRAKTAVENGADLVIELPCPYSCSSAERFAGAAVQILAGFGEGGVSMLSFGCEDDDIALLDKAAEISSELDESDYVKEMLENGVPYPAAVASAAGIPEIKALFDKPNNMLAIEYIKALKKYAPWIAPTAVRRKGAEHDSGIVSADIASASHIRRLISEAEDYSAYVPKTLESEPYLIKNADKAVLMKIMTASSAEIQRMPDVSTHVARRFVNTRETKCELIRTPDDFAEQFKHKAVTLARVRRMMMYLALGVTSHDFFDVPYGRILALNDRGREIFSACGNMTMKYATSMAELEKLSSRAARISELERNAATFQQMCVSGSPEFKSEYTRKIVLTR
ncbi:tRNA(Met) cytidine acetate ligase [Ruminococcus albus]|uniref:tRNA(Met) cytidine acetate ligase n=1 Tax=Ruminococcus albus SY3 TaxID=1341156 RepID=A0A011VQZ2_RUMAL|nr:nucleotidyltransferase family protein [Ruminococcus albus]EXM37681.1 nucleotidyltransferase [Ruminococcus albus SY3]